MKLTITCKVHGDFEQEPAAHLIGKGCFNCAVEERAKLKQVTFEDFVHRSNSVHGNKYAYQKASYAGISQHTIITCPAHGDFKQIAANHCWRKCGCPKCAEYGFNPALPATLYVLVTPRFIGYGVSKTPVQRIRRHAGLLTQHGISILATHTYDFASGADALDLENAVKRKTKAHAIVDIAGFKTEALKTKFLPKLLKCAEKYHGR